MNTDRDNFHDWAKDKPDTSFSDLHQLRQSAQAAQPSVAWGRLGIIAIVAVALIVGFRYFVGH